VSEDETQRLAEAGPAAPPAALAVFADRLDLAQRYAARLASEGTVRGLIGPREVDRLWERHLLNSAVLTDLVPVGARVVDVGSGAGLPGVPMAIRRPDLAVDLVEPMQRRVDFLTETVDGLGLAGAIRVIRGRADDAAVVNVAGNSDWVVARAVAPLDRLVRWCLPLLAPGGRLLALKGRTAVDEVAEHRAAMRRCGAGEIDVERIGAAWLGTPTWVVVVRSSPARTRGNA
jgi:16S rRNA (guanine527-N7)-methyltransferase